jgi:hypothetical protein
LGKKRPQRTQRYRYTLTWTVTGMQSTITRTIWVNKGTRTSEDRQAKERVRYIHGCFRTCFGPTARIDRLVRLKDNQPDLFEKE